jgi:hypothetical protein
MQIGLNRLNHVSRNPLSWLDEMLNAVEHANFFENRATEYSMASTTGTWEEALAEPDPTAGGTLVEEQCCLKVRISPHGYFSDRKAKKWSLNARM